MERLTDLQSQITDEEISKAVSGKKDPYSDKVMESAYFWTDGEETVCDQITIKYEDGTSEVYYGFDTLSLIDKVGFKGKYKRETGKDVSDKWD